MATPLEAVERRIKGSLGKIERPPASLADHLHEPVPMRGAVFERREEEQVDMTFERVPHERSIS
jgi:hypothetical protein